MGMFRKSLPYRLWWNLIMSACWPTQSARNIWRWNGEYLPLYLPFLRSQHPEFLEPLFLQECLWDQSTSAQYDCLCAGGVSFNLPHCESEAHIGHCKECHISQHGLHFHVQGTIVLRQFMKNMLWHFIHQKLMHFLFNLHSNPIWQQHACSWFLLWTCMQLGKRSCKFFNRFVYAALTVVNLTCILPKNK